MCYGLAPYFSGLLEELRKVSFCATSSDEYFNKTNQKGYLSSSSMGKTSSSDVLELFHQSCSKIEEQSIMQISSDGPSVNLKFLDLLSESRSAYEHPDLILIGTCGLHTTQSFSSWCQG